MRVAIAGAHGKIAMRLATRLLARGDTVIGLIRNPDHADDVRATGAEPVVCDLEHAPVEEIAAAVRGADAAVFSVYLRAKADADAAVKASGRDWTIVRPGALSDEPGTGRVRIDTAPLRGEVSRDDVAEVLAVVLHDARASHQILYVNGGEDPIEQALASAFG